MVCGLPLSLRMHRRGAAESRKHPRTALASDPASQRYCHAVSIGLANRWLSQSLHTCPGTNAPSLTARLRQVAEIRLTKREHRGTRSGTRSTPKLARNASALSAPSITCPERICRVHHSPFVFRPPSQAGRRGFASMAYFIRPLLICRSRWRARAQSTERRNHRAAGTVRRSL